MAVAMRHPHTPSKLFTTFTHLKVYLKKVAHCGNFKVVSINGSFLASTDTGSKCLSCHIGMVKRVGAIAG